MRRRHPGLRDHLAGPALAPIQVVLQMQDRLTFALRAHHVASALRRCPEGCLRQSVSLRSAPPTSSLSIALSKALSATIRLSRPLSFSSSLSRLTVSSRAPPYYSFQRW